MNEHERRLKGVEAFALLVALLTASFGILHFLNGIRDAKIHPLLGWLIVSTPIWYVSHFAFVSACHYLLDAEVTYNSNQGRFSFLLLIFVTSVLLDGLGLISLTAI